MDQSVRNIKCSRDHAPQILAVFNEAIANSTALWDYEPRTMTAMEAWFDVKERDRFPVIGVVDHNDKLLAFGSYGPFRAWPAYKYTIEHSVYVEKESRGKGLGRNLLGRLIEEASDQGFHTMIGGIESQNAASRALHEAMGFEQCAEFRQVGFKFGRWLDLTFYQLLLNGPDNPTDGNAR
ncbi:MAG TPA: GNAT family N-acetyltransferase [Acidobacteriaceae bacterium]|nr:GNAT family N-acetyltransferase [Acidobacteriaceae bacterium]